MSAAPPPGQNPPVFLGGRSRRERWGYFIAVLALSALGFGIRREALFIEFVADDYAQLAMLEGYYPVRRSPLDLFSFSDGTAAEGQRLIGFGLYPWWTHPEMRLSMLRPLSSGLIWLDWTLFGDHALAYHVHSLLWWLAMLGAIAALFWQLLPLPVALLAFGILVLDEAHGIPLSWLANRNALSATTFAVASLLAYLRYRQGTPEGGPPGQRRHLVLTMAALATALAAGEYALCIAGYMAAYELLVHRGALLHRVRNLWPVALPIVLYLGARAALQMGAKYSGEYLDPTADPILFAEALVKRFPVMCSDLLLACRAEYWTFGLPWTIPLFFAGWVDETWLFSPEPWRKLHLPIGIASMVLMVALAAATPARGAYRNLRWLYFGGALAVLPAIPSMPASRLLLAALIGFCPMVAGFVVNGIAGLGRTRDRRTGAWLLAGTALLLAGIHLAYAGWSTRREVVDLYRGYRAARRAVLDMEVDNDRLPEQDVVVLASSHIGISTYLPFTRLHHGLNAPRSYQVLSFTPARYRVMRRAANVFDLAVLDGFTMLSTSTEQVMRSPEMPLAIGDTIRVRDMTITVLSARHGRPTSIRVALPVPLEDRSLLLLYPTLEGIKRIDPPAIGDDLVLDPPMIPPP